MNLIFRKNNNEINWPIWSTAGTIDILLLVFVYRVVVDAAPVFCGGAWFFFPRKLSSHLSIYPSTFFASSQGIPTEKET